MDLYTCYDVAIQHGHNAMDHPYLAGMKHEEIAQQQEVLATAERGRTAYLQALSLREFANRHLFDELASAIILFQAMMEALINYSYDEFNTVTSVSNNGSFADKWLSALRAADTEAADFTSYLDTIYRPLRNGLVHPTQEKLPALNGMELSAVYLGLRDGWTAFNSLFTALGRLPDPDSWTTMCEAHGLSGEFGAV